MAYSTQAQLIAQLSTNVLVQLTDDDHLGAVVPSVVTACIAIADSEIDGFIDGRYLVPLSPVPTLVNSWSITLAKYHLFARRDRVSDMLLEERKAIVALLTKVSQGTMTLGVAPPPTAGSLANVGEFIASESVFSRANMEGY